MTRQEWRVKPDGKGAFNAVFELIGADGKSQGSGAALSGISKKEAEAHCAMARRHDAERNEKMALVEGLFNKENWKLATGKFVTTDGVKAGRVHEALEFFCGGAETTMSKSEVITVTSLGYYYYIGA